MDRGEWPGRHEWRARRNVRSSPRHSAMSAASIVLRALTRLLLSDSANSSPSVRTNGGGVRTAFTSTPDGTRRLRRRQQKQFTLARKEVRFQSVEIRNLELGRRQMSSPGAKSLCHPNGCRHRRRHEPCMRAALGNARRPEKPKADSSPPFPQRARERARNDSALVVKVTHKDSCILTQVPCGRGSALRRRCRWSASGRGRCWCGRCRD